MEERKRGAKIVRLPNTRRAREREKENEVPVTDRVKLERVLGLTSNSNAAVSVDTHTGILAYAAGCVIVLFNPVKGSSFPSPTGSSPGRNRPWRFLNNSSKKPITCLAFSRDGRHLASGECGHNPAVRVWDVVNRIEIAVFNGHKFAVNCVAFSPDHKYLVSVGAQHDQVVNVWDWKGKAKVASNKVSTKVKAVDFAENGSYFVTVGHRHVKFWYLEYPRGSNAGKKFMETLPLMGRSAILGAQGNNYFVDVACGVGECGDSTYAITKSGLLCEFNNRRHLDRWVELRTPCANAITAGASCLFIGCADGIVRCFDPISLVFKMTVPRTHHLGTDVSKGMTINHMAAQPNDARYPDCIAVRYDENHEQLSCFYNDHSVYVWDVANKHRIGKSHSFLYHASCIWGVEAYPSVGDGVKPVLPPGTFFTCSSDDTIRIWNLDPKMPENTVFKRNIYSNELLKVIYADPNLTTLCDRNPGVYGSPEKNGGDASPLDLNSGVRCLKVSHDGKHLASGDRAGNIRIHELQFMDELVHIEAHDSEVLALAYSRPESPLPGGTKPRSYLASCSRDRFIHVFEVHKDYDCAQTLADHSSSITAVRFVQKPSSRMLLMSCGADKSIIFREGDDPESKKPNIEFTRYHHVTGKNSLYDMEVDINGEYLLTACQDRCVRVYSLPTGKHTRTFKGSAADDGTLVAITLDPSGMYLATSSTDKTICLYDYCNENLMAVVSGHSEIVTGLVFTLDCRYLISVSGDACVFVWRLPSFMTRASQSRSLDFMNRRETRLPNPRFSLSPAREIFETARNGSREDDSTNYKFSIGDLPSWAKKQIGSANPGMRPARSEFHVNGDGNGNGNNRGLDMPRGRWASRIDTTQSQSLTVRSHHFSDTSIPFPTAPAGPNDSESSKDSSSLDSTGGGGVTFGRSVDGRNKVSNLGFRRLQDDNRHRNLTDDSSVNSFPLEEGETEHEGDIDEDLSETEDSAEELGLNATTLYVPQSMDGNMQFPVNAMDQEELKNARRRLRKIRPSDISNLVSTSVSGSQESDLDVDDDLKANREDPSHSTTPSTPTADPGERNIHGMNMSTESIDQLGQRETYLLRTYDSLAERRLSNDSSKGRGENSKSLSSRFSSSPRDGDGSRTNGPGSARRLSGSSRNADTIEQVLQPQREGHTRRLELRKQIEESRRKLDSVGYAGMRGSRSISDLSRVPDSDVESTSGAPSLQSHISGTTPGGSASRGMRESGSLRRACSLSDLVGPSSPPRRILPSPPSLSLSSHGTSLLFTSTVSSLASSPSPVSVTVGMMLVEGKAKKASTTTTTKGYRTDAEDAGNLQRAPSVGALSGGGGNFMKGTLSTSLKARSGTSSGVQAVGGSRRRIQNQGMSSSQSVSDLRYRRVVDDDSSSEENGRGTEKRSQGLANTRRNVGGSERDLNVVSRDSSVRENRLMAGATRGSGAAVRGSAPDVRKPGTGTTGRRGKSTPVSRQVCEKASSDLCCVARNVVQLYKKVANDPGLSDGDRRFMLQSLGQAALRAQDELQPVISGYLNEAGGGAVVQSNLQMPSAFPVPGPGGNPVMMQFMHQMVAFMQNQPVGASAASAMAGFGFPSQDSVTISPLDSTRDESN